MDEQLLNNIIKSDNVTAFFEYYYDSEYVDIDNVMISVINNNSINILKAMIEDEEYKFKDFCIYDINKNLVTHNTLNYLKQMCNINGFYQYTPLYAVLYDDGELVLSHKNTMKNKGVKRCYGRIDDSPRDNIWGPEEKLVTSVDIQDYICLSNLNSLFCGLINLIEIKHIENLDTSLAINMRHMFAGCEKLSQIDLSHFNTKSVSNMLGMFMGCKNLTFLDLSSFKIDTDTNMEYMFAECHKLEALTIIEDTWPKQPPKIHPYNMFIHSPVLDIYKPNWIKN